MQLQKPELQLQISIQLKQVLKNRKQTLQLAFVETTLKIVQLSLYKLTKVKFPQKM